MTTRDVLNRPLPEVPADWPGTIPEFFIFRAIERTDRVLDIDFQYQGGFFGGRQQRGGIIPDFLILDPRVGINVQGARFHLPPFGSPALDRLQRIQLEGAGIRMEFIGEDEALNRPDEAVREAIAGTRGRGPIEVFEV